MKKNIVIVAVLFHCFSFLEVNSQQFVELNKKFNGPLKVFPANPRYFTNQTGKAILLTGSHTWENFQDMEADDGRPLFDWNGYLDMMQEHNHNFMRFWVWEHPEKVAWSPVMTRISPMPYKRTGKGPANDGKPRFDLDQWDDAYFERMRNRVIDAGNRGIYVSIMMFQGWSQNKLGRKYTDPFLSHPFHKANNINGIDVLNTTRDEEGKPTLHSLGNKKALARQEAYVRKVIETVNDLDNVLYEIINEGGTTEWLYHMVNYIRAYEKTMPKQHMIGLGSRVSPPMLNQELWESPADYISPTWEPAGWSLPGSTFVEDYGDNPPANNYDKVCIVDSDHLWGHGGNYIWAWKSFCRGLQVIFMDPWRPMKGTYDPKEESYIVIAGGITKDDKDYPDNQPLRESMGYIRNYAERMNLPKMIPRSDLSTTTYCLANPGEEYLVFFPQGGKATINLWHVKGEVDIEWFIPAQNRLVKGVVPVAGGYFTNFEAPYTGPAVLYLKKKQ
ncbi:DUF6298 domain-containing protein [Agriterribacter sp.]|uniref:DUF6298 domain-containing protein n=1 Tax=Agriterribacter sp. TaxID=2821509 RepID=UPI002CC781E4|nr:DUF6298 domain-containing protein [Agriterribacter sp.]HRO45713.1 DUF6298 domain-containing protein [Agriterribacter sp.]HRQ15809.1 DUF6298 domain-containing protein [Agriterribacter sp.]